jgi:inhibitor of KinA sporulation pathway (predicted exonuclease)
LYEIIEIGAIKVDKDGKEISRFGKFAKPLKFPVISEFVMNLQLSHKKI